MKTIVIDNVSYSVPDSQYTKYRDEIRRLYGSIKEKVVNTIRARGLEVSSVEIKEGVYEFYVKGKKESKVPITEKVANLEKVLSKQLDVNIKIITKENF